MEEEKVDVLLASYNGEKYIVEQIESILNQTYKNINLIISDDCSKDNTPQILKEYSQKDSRIKIYIQEKNLGVVKNIEFLLKQVKSPLYMLADQDDYWMPEKIEKSVEKIKQDKTDLVFGDLEVVDENLKTIYPSFNYFFKLSKKIKKNINNFKLNYLYNCITGCTILARKETIQYILPLPNFSNHLIHDHWIGLMVNLNGKVTYMSEKYIKYRQHRNNQVGTEKNKYETIEQMRNHFIDVKLGVFKTYVENNERFSIRLQKLNKKSLKYYESLKNKKNINFRHWIIFHKLYCGESFLYYLQNFIILNMPIIGKIIFFKIKNKGENDEKKY